MHVYVWVKHYTLKLYTKECKYVVKLVEDMDTLITQDYQISLMNILPILLIKGKTLCFICKWRDIF